MVIFAAYLFAFLATGVVVYLVAREHFGADNLALAVIGAGGGILAWIVALPPPDEDGWAVLSAAILAWSAFIGHAIRASTPSRIK